MDVLLFEDGRLDAEGRRLGAHIGARRVDRFLHYVAELAGRLHTTFAGQHDRFNLKRLAAHFGPCETRHDTDLIFAFHLAVAELANTRKGTEIFRRDFDRFRLAGDDLLDRLACTIGDLALEVTHAGFPRVVTNEITQRAVGDFP